MRRPVLATIAILVAACGTGPGSAPGSVSSVVPASAPGTSAPGSVSPSVAPSAAPSLTIAPTPAPTAATTPGPVLVGWSYRPWTDPAMEIALPTGWQPIAYPLPADSRPQASQSIEFWQWTSAKVSAGAARLGSVGTLTPQTAASSDPQALDASVFVTVESGDASLEAFADRSASEISFMRPYDRRSISTSAGPAIQRSYPYTVDGQPNVERDTLIRLPDGRSLGIYLSTWAATDGSSPDETAFFAFADQVVGTLATAP
jgi:hypothetical protein